MGYTDDLVNLMTSLRYQTYNMPKGMRTTRLHDDLVKLAKLVGLECAESGFIATDEARSIGSIKDWSTRTQDAMN